LVLVFLFAPARAEPPPSLPEKDCHYLAEYLPDSGIEYTPGVDVHGQPVVPADLAATPSIVPEKPEIFITVDIAKYLGLTVPHGMEGNLNIGKVTLEEGQVLFNGKPLEDEAAGRLKTLCKSPSE
jgi:hypothetical protein